MFQFPKKQMKILSKDSNIFSNDVERGQTQGPRNRALSETLRKKNEHINGQPYFSKQAYRILFTIMASATAPTDSDGLRMELSLSYSPIIRAAEYD